MKYSVQIETESQVFPSSGSGSPSGSGYGTPSSTGRGTPSRQLMWNIEVECLEDYYNNNDDAVMMTKTTPAPVRRVSRAEKQEQLIQKALRKKSRKVS